MMELPDNYKAKSFWSKREGVPGMVAVAGLVVGLVLFGKPILAFIITLLSSLLTAVALGAVVVLILAVLMNAKYRKLISYGFRSVMRLIASVYTTVDPIGIVKNYVEDMENEAKNMYRQIGNLAGLMRTLKGTIEENETHRRENLSMAKEAQKQNKTMVLQVSARQAGRLKKSNMTLVELYKKMEVLYRVLNKYYEAMGIKILDTKQEVEVVEREWKMVKAGHSGMMSARKAMHGGEGVEYFENAMQFMADDLGNKLGEIQLFMDTSKTFIDTLDLQNGVYEADALTELENWEKKSDTMIFGSDTKFQLEDLDDDKPLSFEEAKVYVPLDEEPEVLGAKKNDYEELYK